MTQSHRVFAICEYIATNIVRFTLNRKGLRELERNLSVDVMVQNLNHTMAVILVQIFAIYMLFDVVEMHFILNHRTKKVNTEHVRD